MAFRAELGEVELVDDVRQEVEQVLAADFKVRLLPLLPELLQDGRVDFARRTPGLFQILASGIEDLQLSVIQVNRFQ